MGFNQYHTYFYIYIYIYIKVETPKQNAKISRYQNIQYQWITWNEVWDGIRNIVYNAITNIF